MDKTTNSLNWFEIPAQDLNRSKAFYESIFNMEMETYEMEGTTMAFFPWTPGSGKATGAVAQGESYKPSMEGAVIYLNAEPDLATVQARVEEAGGKVLVPKMNIGENGNVAYILDTEGNKIGLHSNN